MAKQSNRRTRQRSRAGHGVGAGPGNIYLHAVSRRLQAGGPVAVCGHPLRSSQVGSGSAVAADATFEEIASTHQDACEECARILDVDIDGRTAPTPSADHSGFLSFNRVSGTAGVAILVTVMVAARLAVILFR